MSLSRLGRWTVDALGTGDGVRTRFVTAAPYRIGTLVAWVDGLRQPPGVLAAGDGAHVDFIVAPRPRSDLRVRYVRP